MLDPFIRRWSPTILKLAMIMQFFIDPKSNEISVHALYAAQSIIIPAIKSTAKLFEGELTENNSEREMRELKEWICMRIEKGGRPVYRNEILSSKKIKGKAKEYDQALDMLIQCGEIIHKKGTQMKFDTYEPAPK